MSHKKISYKIKTLSSLIVSPRDNLAFYRAMGEFNDNDIASNAYDASKINIIYPFYRYGEYEKYVPPKVDDCSGITYYLPGSSIKGALQLNSNEKLQKAVMVDDIVIANENIVLRNLYKAQYIQNKNITTTSATFENENTQTPKFDVFFENVAVEMVKGGATLDGGEIYLKNADEGAWTEILKTAVDATKVKINQMISYLNGLIKKNNSVDFVTELHEIVEKLNDVLRKNVILIGGYKGFLHSIISAEKINAENVDDIESAIFIDRATYLPHGLVEIITEEDV